MIDYCQPSDKLLILWSSQIDETNGIKQINALKKKIISESNVVIECFDRLSKAKYPNSHFDVALFGFISEEKQKTDLALLSELQRILKENQRVYFKKNGKDDCVMGNFISALKLSGFIDIEEKEDLVTAKKPNYETGVKIKISTKEVIKSEKNVKDFWQQLAEDDVGEIINTDDLLTEDDLKKPDPESLKVCGSTGKRKACANCTCGLAEELDNETRQERKTNTENVKSSCGNCYLGDAFRCASCPYLGTPAFKPGEKVILNNLSDL